MNVSETDAFTSNVTGETYKINHKFKFDQNYLINLLSCKCRGKPYIEETTDTFRYRWNNYNKDNDRKNARSEDCMEEHLFKYFNSMEHWYPSQCFFFFITTAKVQERKQ